MAFAGTVSASGTLGPLGMKMTWGTFTNASGDTGGTIETGFANVVFFGITVTSHLGSQYPKVTWSTSDGTVTIVTEDAVDGNWVAFGIGEG